MDNYIVILNDDLGGRDRKIYITSWGTSPWSIHAKEFDNSKEADKKLKDFISNNTMGIIYGEVKKK